MNSFLYFSQKAFKSIGIVIVILFIASCKTTPSEGDKSRAFDPFPKEILNHKIFKVFRGENRLGYTFRDENRQLFGDKFWGGQESRTRGEDKTIAYTKENAVSLSARFPAIGGIKGGAGYKKVSGFRVILRGLKIHEIKRPFVLPEYASEGETKTTSFIISMLSADEIIIQVQDESGVNISSGFVSIFSGDVNFSRRQRGAVAAKNVFLGYILTPPTKRDLARKPSKSFLAKTGKNLIKLAVFPPDNKTDDNKLEWLPESLKSKLEEAFQRLPQFYVLTSRKSDARYQLRGAIKKIGSRVEITLALIDTDKNEQLQKLYSTIKTNSVDQLYEYQMKVITNFIKPFGVKITKKETENVKQAVKSGSNIELEKMMRKGWRVYYRADYQDAVDIGKKMLSMDPNHIGGMNLLAWTLKKLGRYTEAMTYANKMVVEAKKRNDQTWLSKAYGHIGGISRLQDKMTKALDYLTRAANIRRRLKGPNHPKTRFAFNNLALAYSRNKQYRKALKIYLKSEKIFLKEFGEDHSHLATLFLNIGANYSRAKEYEKAIEYLFNGVRIAKIKSGRDHPFVGKFYGWIGVTYYYMKDYVFAKRYLLTRLEIYEKKLGSSHRNTKLARSWMESVNAKLKKSGKWGTNI